MSEISPVEFGQMREQIRNLNASVEKLEVAVEKLTDALSEARGGWKILAVAGSVIAALSAGLAWFLAHIDYKP